MKLSLREHRQALLGRTHQPSKSNGSSPYHRFHKPDQPSLKLTLN